MRLPFSILVLSVLVLQASAGRQPHAKTGVVSLEYAFPRPEAPRPEDACEWSVTYDAWLPTFDKGEYEGVSEGGTHCLAACCADPTCMGLSMMSGERYQCYKYSNLPTALSAPNYQHRDLGDSAWIQQLPSRWSVFVKRPRPGFEQQLALLPSVVPGTPSPESQESALDMKLRHVQAMTMPQQGQCQWMVHYDRWIETFEKGEFEGVQHGGPHCLEVCCQDPTCLGLAMESSEMYQCYKYTQLPTALLANTPPQNLSDGIWLLDKKPAWSIFIKGAPAWRPAPTVRPSPPTQPVVQVSPQPAAPAEPAAAVQPRAPEALSLRLGRPGGSTASTSWIWQVLQMLLVIVAFFLAQRFVGAFIAPRLIEKFRLGPSSREGTKLLSGGIAKVPI